MQKPRNLLTKQQLGTISDQLTILSLKLYYSKGPVLYCRNKSSKQDSSVYKYSIMNGSAIAFKWALRFVGATILCFFFVVVSIAAFLFIQKSKQRQGSILRLFPKSSDPNNPLSFELVELAHGKAVHINDIFTVARAGS